jgi:hypothetical protein
VAAAPAPSAAPAEPPPTTAAAGPPAAAPAEPPRKPEPVAAAPTPKPEPARRQPARKPARREPERVAKADPTPTPAAPAVAPKKSGGVLDFDDNDAALNEALGGSKTPSGRSVYVPPAAGATGALPKEVSTVQIQEAVAGRVDALRRCVAEQKTREPDESGVLKMAWVIAGDGAPKDVRCVTPEYASGQFAACITGVIRNIRFPKTQTTGQPVTFPFSF